MAHLATLRADCPPAKLHSDNTTSSAGRDDPYTQIGPFHEHPVSADVVTNSEQCDSSRQVAQGWLQAVPDIDLNQTPAQEDPKPTQPEMGFRLHQSLTQLAT